MADLPMTGRSARTAGPSAAGSHRLPRIACVLLACLIGALAATQPAAAQDAVVTPGDSIQSAVDAAGPDDVIAVQDGDYNQSVTVTRSRNLTIRAADGAAPVLNGTLQPKGTTLLELAPQNDTAIQGLRIEGLRFLNIPSHAVGSYLSGHGIAMFTTNVVHDVAIVDNGFDNTDIPPPSDHEGAGIVLDNVDGLTVADNTLRGVARDGSVIGRGATFDQKSAINVHDYGDANTLQDVAISGNTIVNVTRGMWIGGGSTTNTVVDNVTVADNRIEDVLREGIRAEVAAPSGSGRLVVERNVLVDADAALRVNNGEVVVRDVLISGEAPDYGVAAGDHYGIGLEDGGDVTVRGADVADQAADGVKVLNGNLTLIRSTVEGNGVDGLDVRDPTVTLDRVDVGSAVISGEATQVTVDEAVARPPYPDDRVGVDSVFNASNQTASGYFDATAAYSAGAANGVDEQSLALHRYDDAAGNWTELSSTADPTTDTVSVNITAFSTFSVLGNGSTAGSGPVEAGSGSVSAGEPTDDAGDTTADTDPSTPDEDGASLDAETDEGESDRERVGGGETETREVREPGTGPGVIDRFWPLLILLFGALALAARYATRDFDD